MNDNNIYGVEIEGTSIVIPDDIKEKLTVLLGNIEDLEGFKKKIDTASEKLNDCLCGSFNVKDYEEVRTYAAEIITEIDNLKASDEEAKKKEQTSLAPTLKDLEEFFETLLVGKYVFDVQSRNLSTGGGIVTRVDRCEIVHFGTGFALCLFGPFINMGVTDDEDLSRYPTVLWYGNPHKFFFDIDRPEFLDGRLKEVSEETFVKLLDIIAGKAREYLIKKKES